MNREHILGVLYDLSLTIGSEVSLKPLLDKTLQRMLHHSGYPCGLVLLNNCKKNYGTGNYCFCAALGDSEALHKLGDKVMLPAELVGGKVEVLEAGKLLEQVPCRQDRYNFIFKLPIADQGVILLLSPQESHNKLPLQQMFLPILAHLARAIQLCQTNDLQKDMLQKEVEAQTKAISEREEQMRLLLSSTAEGIFGLDMEGKCTFVNTSALNLLGYDDEGELIGRMIHPMIHHTKKDGSHYPVEECRNFLATQQGIRAHVDDECYWRKDGSSFPVEYHSTPIRKGNASVGQIITFTDISARLEAEKQKVEAQARLEHTQRLESLGVLTGGIAHDFNNLLTAILGNTTLAQQKIESYTAEYELLDQVIEASESAADLCKQMLAYSGKGKFTIKPINISHLVQKMTKLLQVSIHKGSFIRYDLAKEIPLIEGDVAQMRQVIMNLITNANEALEEQNGTISITTGTIRIDEQYMATTYLDEGIAFGDYVFVEVTDTGCGMSEEQKNKIFEPFYSTKVSGRGLGMSAMLGIVRGHQGTLKIYSELGKGTSVKVMFPVSEAALEEEEQVQHEVFNGKGKTILVIDDESLLRKVATSMLATLGFTVITAENGLEGIEKYAEHQADISIILLDMMMPVMNGEETFQKLRLMNPEVKVLLCSGYNEQEATQRFTGKGLAGFIQKPYRLNALSESIAEILATGR